MTIWTSPAASLQNSRERANDVHFEFWFCSHLQPLGSHLSLKQVNFNTCKNCKISSLALQKFGIYSRTSLGSFHDFSASSSGENRNFFAEQHCRNLGFLQSCVRRNHDVLRTEVAVTCSDLTATCLGSHLQVAASGAKWKLKIRTSCELNETFSKH